MTIRSTLKRRLIAAGLAVPLLATTAIAFAQGPAPVTPPAPPAAGSPQTPNAPAAPSGPDRNAPRSADPVTVSELRDMGNIALSGRVVEIFGNAFVLEDGTGRALVETGPQGNRETLVAMGDEVTVEGRFGDGQVQARAIVGADGERVLLERPRRDRDGPHGPGRDGPRERADGPRGEGPGERGPRGEGPGPRGERAERPDRGGWFGGGGVDEAAAEAALTAAGYTEVALLDVKRHHAEFTARDAAGAQWTVKVDEDNAIAEREPYAEPLSEDAARAAVEALGYTWIGDYETRGGHVAAEARDAGGREVRVEIAADGSLLKERFAN